MVCKLDKSGDRKPAKTDSDPAWNRAVGAVIARHRKLAKMTQGQLAQDIQMSRVAVANFERGKTALLLHRAADICHFIGINIADLVREADKLVMQGQPAQCDGFDGPCDSMEAKERKCRTAYNWDGAGQNPNRTPMLCDECAQAYDEYWNEMWAQAR